VNAQAFASDTMEVIEVIQAAGITTAGGIAGALNKQGVAAPRGGRRSAVQVIRVMDQLGAD
jgi:hypothetical protein